MKKAANIVGNSKDILILTHKNPDGDAVGSVLGLAIALLERKKKVSCFFIEPVPKVFEFLPNIELIKNNVVPQKYDLVTLLDCDSFERTGIEDTKNVFISYDNLLIIDHHPKRENNNFKGNYFSIIDSKACSTTMLIYKFLCELNIEITKDIANCLLTGIFTDTGSFQHSNTDEETLKTAAEFMKKGSRVDKIARNIFNNKTIQAIKIWGKALSRVKTDENTGMAISYLSKKDLEEYDVSQEDISGLVSIINTISDAKFSLLLTEYDDNKVKGSLRSEEYKGIDVSKIAKSLGGGGHKLASGFEIKGNIENSIQKINKMIIESNLESEIAKQEL